MSINTGSVVEYALAFTNAALDKHYSKWSATPKTDFIDITTSEDFYQFFSSLQVVSAATIMGFCVGYMYLNLHCALCYLCWTLLPYLSSHNISD